MPWVWTKNVYYWIEKRGGGAQLGGNPKKVNQDYNIIGPKQIL
jgi:hypothetical protein